MKFLIAFFLWEIRKIPNFGHIWPLWMTWKLFLWNLMTAMDNCTKFRILTLDYLTNEHTKSITLLSSCQFESSFYLGFPLFHNRTAIYFQEIEPWLWFHLNLFKIIRNIKTVPILQIWIWCIGHCRNYFCWTFQGIYMLIENYIYRVSDPSLLRK